MRTVDEIRADPWDAGSGRHTTSDIVEEAYEAGLRDGIARDGWDMRHECGLSLQRRLDVLREGVFRGEPDARPKFDATMDAVMGLPLRPECPEARAARPAAPLCACGHGRESHDPGPGGDADDSCEECGCPTWTEPKTVDDVRGPCGRCGHAASAHPPDGDRPWFQCVERGCPCGEYQTPVPSPEEWTAAARRTWSGGAGLLADRCREALSARLPRREHVCGCFDGPTEGTCSCCGAGDGEPCTHPSLPELDRRVIARADHLLRPPLPPKREHVG